MDEINNEEILNQEENDCEALTVQISKHCPDPDCAMYGLPQPGRTYCIECGTALVA